MPAASATGGHAGRWPRVGRARHARAVAEPACRADPGPRRPRSPAPLPPPPPPTSPSLLARRGARPAAAVAMEPRARRLAPFAALRLRGAEARPLARALPRSRAVAVEPPALRLCAAPGPLVVPAAHAARPFAAPLQLHLAVSARRTSSLRQRAVPRWRSRLAWTPTARYTLTAAPVHGRRSRLP
nr:uncharacterized protein LOC127326540 [Lolium perenne]